MIKIKFEIETAIRIFKKNKIFFSFLFKKIGYPQFVSMIKWK